MNRSNLVRSLFLRVMVAAILLARSQASVAAEPEAHGWSVKPFVPSIQRLFPQGAVRLLDGPFKTMQDVDHAYLMRLEPDRLLAQFRVEAGLEPKAKPYGGWESPAQPGKTWSLAGHSLGHYLSALSLMYRMTDDDQAVSVNLFIASELQWAERGLALRQETRFPDQNGTTLVITTAPAEPTILRIRHPFWLAARKLTVRINGGPTNASSQPGGFAELKRLWKAGDRVEVDLPMRVRVVRQAQCSGWISFFYGPILLAGELGSDGLTQSDYIGPYTPIKAMLPLAKAPLIVADNDKDLLARIARC